MAKTFGFSKEYAKRIVGAVDSAASPPMPNLPPMDDEPLACIVHCSAGCAAGDNDGPGVGVGVVQIVNESGEYDDFFLPGGGTLSVTFYNITQQTLEAGKMFLVKSSFSNHWIVVVADC